MPLVELDAKNPHCARELRDPLAKGWLRLGARLRDGGREHEKCEPFICRLELRAALLELDLGILPPRLDLVLEELDVVERPQQDPRDDAVKRQAPLVETRE